jgi:acyl carrier protein
VPAVHDQAALRARCPQDTTTPYTGSIGSLAFGPHWRMEATRHSAGPLELVDLRLREESAADAAGYYLHPALLDWCVVLGQSVTRDARHLPFCYEKISVYGPLPASVTSIVSHRDDCRGEVTVADVTVLDGTGTELVAIEGFIMASASGQRDAERPPASGSSRDTASHVDPTLAESAVLNSQGEKTLRRVLGGSCGPQLIWCPEGLAERLRRSAAVTRRAILARADGSAPATANREHATPYVEPATATERLLAGLWAEVIGVDQVGADDDFFDLGGNSLVAVQLVARMSQKLRAEVSVAMMFDARTVRGLAAALGEAPAEASPSLPDLDPMSAAAAAPGG